MAKANIQGVMKRKGKKFAIVRNNDGTFKKFVGNDKIKKNTSKGKKKGRK